MTKTDEDNPVVQAKKAKDNSLVQAHDALTNLEMQFCEELDNLLANAVSLKTNTEVRTAYLQQKSLSMMAKKYRHLIAKQAVISLNDLEQHMTTAEAVEYLAIKIQFSAVYIADMRQAFIEKNQLQS